MREKPTRHPLQVFPKVKVSAGSVTAIASMRKRAKSRLAQATPENRQGAGTACLVAADSGKGMPKVLGARVYFPIKTSSSSGSIATISISPRICFVLQSGGRSPITVDNAVAVHLRMRLTTSSPQRPTLWARGGTRGAAAGFVRARAPRARLRGRIRRFVCSVKRRTAEGFIPR